MKRVALALALCAAAATATAQTEADRPTPADLPSAEVALANGVEKLCPWFLSGRDYSMSKAGQTAFDAGYKRGSSVQYMPVGMSATGGTSALGFQARIKDAPAQGSGVPAFLGFDPANCQMQVWGYKAESDAYFGKLESLGWKRIDQRSMPTGNITSVVFDKWVDGQNIRLTYNRWTNPTPPENGLWAVINMQPGAGGS